MSVFSKFSLYLPLLLTLTVSSTSHAELSKPLKAEAFSDPDYVTNMQPGFLERAIKYDAKVANDVDVVISLGQQTYPALQATIKELAKQHGIKVDVQQGTCGVTAKKLSKKSIDIGTYCCPPGESDRLPGLKFHTIALAPIALITHQDNPISNVSTVDAKKIFGGEYVTWTEVPSIQSLSEKLMGERIQPVVRPHCEKKPGHWRLLMNSQDDISPRAQSVGTIPDMVAQVANDMTAIGYETPYMLEVHKDKGRLKTINIDGINPEDTAALISGAYPLYRAYNMSTWANENNRNEKAEILMDAIYDYVQNHGAENGFIAASKLKSAGWKFKERELIAEPDGQPVITAR